MVPDPEDLDQYRTDITAYPEQCLSNASGSIPTTVLDIAYAVLDAQVADAQLVQLHELVAI